MKSRRPLSICPNKWFQSAAATACLALSLADPSVLLAQQAESAVVTTTTTTDESPKIPDEQLESLVAPIALYPDPLLSQTLVASTYPLEIIQLQQWLDRNPGMKDKALADAVAKQPWDPSIQAMAAFPDVVKKLSANVQWTSDMGNAFLAQQGDVMAAVQRLRAKAEGTGNLKTSAQQKVETQTVEGGKQVIVIEQANPEVVYVPSYDSTVVYGASAYPYPSLYYPGYVPGMALAWGAGLALGAAWGGGWGWGAGWNNGDININNNNNFNRNSNRNSNRNVNRGQGGQGGRWQHNPSHRGNAPYGDRGTANKFGGRGPGGAGGAGRPGGPGGAGGIGGAGRPGGPGGAGGIGGAGKPGGIGGAGGAGRPGGPGGAGKPGGIGGAGGAGRPGGAGGAGRPGGAGGVGRPGGAGSNARPGGGSRPSSMPANRGGSNSIGGRSPSRGGGSSAFSGGGGMGGRSARSASSRGGRSMGGSRGGGGGGRGGGGRRR